jgi:capsular polysaccharide biosynthesis protein
MPGPLGLARERANKVMEKALWTAAGVRAAPFRRHDLDLASLDPPVRPGEYITASDEPTYVEPAWGYAISAGGRLVEESLRPNFDYPGTPWRVAMPSHRSFRRAEPSGRVIHLPEAISLRHLWEWNYYHFFLDVLGRLSLFDAAGLSDSIPLVVGRYVMELPFAQQAIAVGALGRRTWVIQDHQYVRADRLYFCRTQRGFRDRIGYLLEQLGLPGSEGRNDRIFLTRGASALGRKIVNSADVEKVLAAHGFVTVDTAAIPFEQQMDIFANARYLVAIHGAGITNIIFRGSNPLSVLELSASTFYNLDFAGISQECGYRWDHLTGPPAEGKAIHADFHIDVGQLELKLEEMLAG